MPSDRSRFDPRAVFVLAVLCAYVLWPAIRILGESVWTSESGLTLDPWREFVREGHTTYAVRSVMVSILTVVLSALFGTGLAFLFQRFDFPGRGVMSGLALLPFTLPPLVGVFAIWTLLAEDGLLHRASMAVLGRGLWIEKGYLGVLIVHVYSMYVYFFVLVGGAISALDETQVEAARNLGAGRWAVMSRVILPQLLPALAGASLLTFMTSMASFTAPYFYMAGRPVLTVGIQQAVESARPGLASADSVVLILSASLFLLGITWMERAALGGTKGVSRRRIALTSKGMRLFLSLFATLITLVLLSPQFSMLREAFIRPGTGFFGRPAEYTLVNFRRLFEEARNFAPIANSLKAAGLATCAVTFFALLTAWLEERGRFAGRGVMRWLVMLPWALPGTVIAIGLLWITRTPGLLTGGLALRGTIKILALAYFIRLIPLAHRTLRGGLLRVPKELELAARDLGARPLQAFARVTFPLLLPSVLAAASLTFVTAMGEYVSSVLLQGPANEPISIRIDQLRAGPAGMQMAAAYSVLLLVLITVVFVMFGRQSRKAVA